MLKNEVSKNSRKKILELEKSLINIADGINVEIVHWKQKYVGDQVPN